MTNPSLTIPELTALRDSYTNGVLRLQSEIKKMEADVIATNGVVQFLNMQVDALTKKQAEAEAAALPQVEEKVIPFPEAKAPESAGTSV